MISLHAPAKINLFLHVTGKEPNSYHYLDSLVAFSDIGDQIDLAPAKDYALDIRGLFAPMMEGMNAEDNLISKAVRAYAAHIGEEPNVKITLHKNLPLSAGIGGGSSDAATAIWALMQHFGRSDTREDLKDLLMSIGADVPVCFNAKTTHMHGFGEKFNDISELPECYIVLINPLTPCPTQAVFQSFPQGMYKPQMSLTSRFDNFAHLIEFLKFQENDLQEHAKHVVPAIHELLNAMLMQDECALVRMTGSGATCFGLFETQEMAQRAQKKLQGRFRQCWIQSGRIGGQSRI